MDKETHSNYGWIVICVLVLAVMLALASPFGKFISTAVQSTTQGLFDVNQSALGAAGIEIMGQEFENELNGDSGGDQGGTETPTEPVEDIVAPEKAKFEFYLYNSEFSLSVTMEDFPSFITTYTAEEGMTWAEWVESEYNTSGCTVSGSTITSPTTTGIKAPMIGTAVLPTDQIESNAYYSFFDVVFAPEEYREPVIISFTIDGKTYQAEEGMPWTSWIFSTYNTDKFSFKGDGVSANGYLHNADETQKIYLCCTDSVIANYNYQSSN